MRRVCMDCRTELGEKCPHCGSEVLQPIARRVVGAVLHAFLHCSFSGLFDGWVKCSACQLEFTLGGGGETTGLCNPCKVRRYRDVEILKAERAVEMRRDALLSRRVRETVGRGTQAADPEQKGSHPVSLDSDRLSLCGGEPEETEAQRGSLLGRKTLYLGKLFLLLLALGVVVGCHRAGSVGPPTVTKGTVGGLPACHSPLAQGEQAGVNCQLTAGKGSK